jgi:predicted DNA repair protein MutK
LPAGMSQPETGTNFGRAVLSSSETPRVPASSLLTLLDDIASVLDDVAILTKVAAKKTAGVLGDDLALNAQQVSGVAADRELGVVWAVAKGSALNKAILVPGALVVSSVLPVAVTPLLMIGGAYLCFEGFEKVAHKVLHREDAERAHGEHVALRADAAVDLVALEKSKIKGAIRTDFILSAEIVIIALGEVAHAPFGTRVAVLVTISTAMTVGVYGLVAGIVKLDDLGLALSRREGQAALQGLGRGVLVAAPLLMKLLSVAGTVAMFLVGGSIVLHGLPVIAHTVDAIEARYRVLGWVVAVASDLVVGLVTGALLLLLLTIAKKVVSAVRA